MFGLKPSRLHHSPMQVATGLMGFGAQKFAEFDFAGTHGIIHKILILQLRCRMLWLSSLRFLALLNSSTITCTENDADPHCNDCGKWIKVANPLQVRLCILNNRRVFFRCSNHLKHFNKTNTTWEPLPLINCLRKHIT